MSKDNSSVRDLELIAWRAADIVRGVLDIGEYRHIIVLFFLKFVSDLALDRSDKAGFYEGIPAWRGLVIPPKCHWDFVRAKVGLPDFFFRLDQALKTLEGKNPDALRGVAELGSLGKFSAEQSTVLFAAFEAVSRADLRPSRFRAQDELGNFFDWLLRLLADAEGRSGEEFHVPLSLAVVLARVLGPQPDHLILDPFCGSGLLLSQLARYAGAARCAAQHPSPRSLSLCKMNFVFQGIESPRVQVGNALRDPLRDSSGDLLKADVVVCNPPFGWRKWGGEDLQMSRPELFQRGLNPRGGSEYAFLEHMLEVARERTGRIGIIVSPGALFRQEERESRRRLVEENLLSAVVGLPPNLFQGTALPVAVLFLDKAKTTDDVLFVNASRRVEVDGRLNRLPDSEVKRIVGVFRDREEVHDFARRVSREEMRSLDFRLSVPSYVGGGVEGESLISTGELSCEIREIESELAQVRREIDDLLRTHEPSID